MNLHSFTLSNALLASAGAMAQEAPPRPGAARTPSEEIKLLPPEQVGKLPPKPGQGIDGKRLPQPDNPLDPNRPAKSDKEPAKIRPAEHAAVPAENAKKVQAKGDTSVQGNQARTDAQDSKTKPAAKPAAKPAHDPADKDAKPGNGAKVTKPPVKEAAKIRPAEHAAVPAENTGKAKAKAKEVKEKEKEKSAKQEQQDKQASVPPATRRAVPMMIDGMPPAQPTGSYGPSLATQPAAPTSLPTTSVTRIRPSAPAIVNSCDAGGCTDTNGVRYNGSAGSTMVGPGGRACQNNGVTMQC